MNKKGDISFNTILWVPKIIFAIIVLFTIVLLIRSFIVTELDIFNAEADIFVQRILMSRNGISYIDPDLDRTYPGIIDENAFRSVDIDTILNTSIYYGDTNKKIAANITLIRENGEFVRSIIYNPDYFYRWKELLRAHWVRGPGGVRGKTKDIQVLIKEQDRLKNGMLKVEVIIPNS